MDTLFQSRRNWIFDLDNTLYHPRLAIFDKIDAKMGEFIANLLNMDLPQARIVQKDYFRNHGTTLAGLMRFHNVEPHHFLDFVHDVDLSTIKPQPELAAQIATLPGEKYIFTNADAPYAQKVLAKLGLDGLFTDVHDIHATGYQPKPEASAYTSMLDSFGIAPEESAFFEDMARNLKPANQMGIATIWINNGAELGAHDHHDDHIDLTANSIEQALDTIHAMF
jgi:putative hydrolase of the HAD superfamily